MMKKLLILLSICLIQNIFSQTIENQNNIELTFEEVGHGITPEADNPVYSPSGLEVKPDFPGGMIAFDRFIEQNFKIPKENSGIKGKIFVGFVVEKDGSLNDIKVFKDLGSGTGTEAIRVLKLSPKWNSGQHESKNVRVMYTIPIIIK
nr:energy transducer TonB [uncultured Flavobacterium sp.]